MRRAVITASATAAGVVLLLSLKPHDAATTAAISSVSGTGSGSAGQPQDASHTSAAPSTTPSTTGSSRTVTGTAINTRYGPVQVKLTLSGSTISKIDVIQYPTRDRRDQEINSYAIPVLNQEAIAAQNASIDVVSGATYTSEGYTRSLQSALDQAAK
ncbi:FMN-binding protein [Kitasatospora sp. NPDC049285]|uniref:FMN-binding protein n=1 Tax=Kitasatospora sp. NPDC049285 TaxID=3157096 RepID=UPI003441CC99